MVLDTPSNRQMALGFRGEKNPIILSLHRCVRSRNQPQHLKHQHCSIFVNHISSMKYLMLENFGSHLRACQPNSPQHSHNREDSELISWLAAHIEMCWNPSPKYQQSFLERENRAPEISSLG